MTFTQKRAKIGLLKANRNKLIVVGKHTPFATLYAAGGSDYACTVEIPFTAIKGITRVSLLFGTQGLQTISNGAAETDRTTGLIGRASLIDPNRRHYTRMTMNGKDTFAHFGVGPAVQIDEVGFFLNGGDTGFLRFIGRVSMPPTSPAAVAASGGYLPVATYYYVITSIDTEIESGPTAEVSAASASTNNSIALTWTPNAFASGYRIYRSATSGGTKELIAQVMGPVGKYVDQGLTNQMSGVNPPAARTRPVMGAVLTGWSANSDNADRTDQTSGFLSPGPIAGTPTTPIAILADDVGAESILTLGDSIGAGQGFVETGPVNRQENNFIDLQMRARNVHSANMSTNGGTSVMFTDTRASGAVRTRLKMMQYATIVLNEMGINDAGNTTTWQEMAVAHLRLARMAYEYGCRYWLTTLPPYVVSTDNCLTIASQTVTAREGRRQSYNQWVYGGCQVDGTGAPVISGGTPSPYIDGMVDRAAVLEVNAANVLTRYGGYMRVPTAPVYSGLVATGTPTTTSLPYSGATIPANTMPGYVIKVTSGARAGQVAVVAGGTSNPVSLYADGSTAQSGVAVVGLSGALAAGDTFDIYHPFSNEGLHYTKLGHSIQSTGAYGPFLDAKGIA